MIVYQSNYIIVFVTLGAQLSRGPICQGLICGADIFQGPNLPGPNIPRPNLPQKIARGLICRGTIRLEPIFTYRELNVFLDPALVGLVGLVW